MLHLHRFQDHSCLAFARLLAGSCQHYGSFLSVGLRLLLQRTSLPLRLQRVIGWGPFAATTADWLENGCLLIMLFSYPAQLTVVARISTTSSFFGVMR